MKKFVSALLICFLLVGSMLALVSCGGDIANGTYVYEAPYGYKQTLEIKGNKLIMVQDGGDEGKLEIVFNYEVKEDGDSKKIYLSYKEMNLETDDVEIKTEFNENKAEMEEQYKGETYSAGILFEETDKGFKMMGVEYVKQ